MKGFGKFSFDKKERNETAKPPPRDGAPAGHNYSGFPVDQAGPGGTPLTSSGPTRTIVESNASTPWFPPVEERERQLNAAVDAMNAERAAQQGRLSELGVLPDALQRKLGGKP